MTAPTAPAPGYYADPLDPTGERWWNGSAWTETVRPAVSFAQPQLQPQAEPAAQPAAQAQTGGIPATEPTPTVPPGLYPDPYGQAPLRWWDGQQWTTQVSGPVDGRTPAFAPHPGGHTGTILPSAATGWSASPYAAAHQRYHARPSRLDGSLVKRLLAAGLPLAVVAGAGVVVLVTRDSKPTFPAPATVASAVNLRATDLPAGWELRPPDSDTDSSDDPTGPAFDDQIAKCTGAPDHATAEALSAGSPTWARGTTEISSNVTVMKTTALAQQDLTAQQGPALAACFGRVGAPFLRAAFARKGVRLTGLSVTRLPNPPADGTAVRITLTIAAEGRSLTMYIDGYGFVRGRVEVDVSQVGVGVVPNPAVALQALAALRSRTVAAVPAQAS